MAVQIHISTKPPTNQIICFLHASCHFVPIAALKIWTTPNAQRIGTITSMPQSMSRNLRWPFIPALPPPKLDRQPSTQA
jgi:hypothetical protein